MICIAALPILAILGIFSAYYRKLAWESVDCVFRRVTFRKCHHQLDEKIKSKLVGKLMKTSPFVAGKIYKYFEVFAWGFVILTLVSGFFAAQGLYNYAVYGNCNGPDSNDFCIFDPLGNNNGDDCSVEGFEGEVTIPDYSSKTPLVYSEKADITIVQFGCFVCPFTNKTESELLKILDKYEGRINFYYYDFPLESYNYSFEASEAVYCAAEQKSYWKYRNTLLKEDSLEEGTFLNLAKELGLDEDLFGECLRSKEYTENINNDYSTGLTSGIYGTPTFFINGKSHIGPLTMKEFENLIR